MRLRGSREQSYQKGRQEENQTNCQGSDQKKHHQEGGKGKLVDQDLIFLSFLLFCYLLGLIQIIFFMISTNPQHPWTSGRRLSLNPPQQSPPPPRVIPMSPNRFQTLPPPQQMGSPQPRVTFNKANINIVQSQQNQNGPVFRQLRQKFARPPSATVIEMRSSQKTREEPQREVQQKQTQSSKVETLAIQTSKFQVNILDPKQQSNEQALKKEKMKYDKLKTTFDSAPTVFVDKKGNVMEVAQNRTEKVQTSNNRIECILEEKPVLEQSRALFSQIQFLKKKVNDFEDSNDRLRAEVHMLKTKLAAEQEEKERREQEWHQRERELETKKEEKEDVKIQQEVRQLLLQVKKRQENQSQLQKELKMLQIQLHKAKNQSKMSKINQSQISKKCHQLLRKNKEQAQQIQNLKSQLSQKDLMLQNIPQTNYKSQPGTESVTYILN